jgi:hypothetical protein
VQRQPWRGWPAIALLATYVALAVVVFLPLWADPTRAVVEANRGDSMLDAWLLAWTPWAISHGHDPWLTLHLNSGIGINLGWNTLVPVLGLLLAPVTVLAGPVVAVTTGMTLGLALSAWALAMVLGRLPIGPRIGRLPAAVGGLIFGFSPSIVSHSTGHLNFTFLALVPVILWLALRLGVGVGSWRRDGTLLGLACGLQLLVNEEVLLLTVLMGLVMGVFLARRHRDVVRERWRPVLWGSGVAVVVATALGSWQLLTQFRGPLPIKYQIYNPDLFSADLAGLTRPTPYVLFGGKDEQATQLANVASESSGYLGWPMILLCVGALILVRDRLMRIALAAALICTVLSFGSALRVDGEVTRVRLPWGLVQPYPLIENVLPTRWPIMTALWLGVAAAAALQALPRRRWGMLLLAVALVPWLPVPHTKHHVEVPSWFADGAPGVRPGSGVLVLPYPSPARIEPMVWQAEARFRFTMPGGYFIGPDREGHPYIGGVQLPSSGLFTEVSEQGKLLLTDERRTQLADDLARWRTETIVVGPAPHRDLQLELVQQLVGRGPDEVTGGVSIWRNIGPADVLPD